MPKAHDDMYVNPHHFIPLLVQYKPTSAVLCIGKSLRAIYEVLHQRGGPENNPHTRHKAQQAAVCNTNMQLREIPNKEAIGPAQRTF